MTSNFQTEENEEGGIKQLILGGKSPSAKTWFKKVFFFFKPLKIWIDPRPVKCRPLITSRGNLPGQIELIKNKFNKGDNLLFYLILINWQPNRSLCTLFVHVCTRLFILSFSFLSLYLLEYLSFTHSFFLLFIIEDWMTLETSNVYTSSLKMF